MLDRCHSDRRLISLLAGHPTLEELVLPYRDAIDPLPSFDILPNLNKFTVYNELVKRWMNQS